MTMYGEDAVEIRTMSILDYEGVYRLWVSTPGIGLNSLDDSRKGVERYLGRNPQTSFVAVKGGCVIGAILCGHDGRRGYIYHMAVEVSERNRGIGKALLNAALAALEDECINKAALVVFSHNETGNTFWKQRGFTARKDLIYRNAVIALASQS